MPRDITTWQPQNGSNNDLGTAVVTLRLMDTPLIVDKKQNSGGKKGRSGPPLANLNAAKTGGGITRLTLGELPNTMRRQLQNARKYRRFVEGLVVEAHGGVSATQAHLIDEAAAAEVHASVCRWLMRTRLEKMSVADIARCSEQILKSKTIRNKAIERLKLDAPPPDPWNVIDAEANGKAT